MNFQEKSRTEYVRRVNRVMDFIDGNLDRPLGLRDISEIAGFSPFHFHRIFTFLTGETPIDYIQRLRIERAAWRLRGDRDASVGEIADSCGFGTVSLFCRVFKKFYGVTPGRFRDMEKAVYSQNGVLFSKNGLPVSKNMTRPAVILPHLCGMELNRCYFMETSIEVRVMPEMRAIYCRHTGSFRGVVAAYEKLFKWAVPRGLYTPNVTKTATVTHDDPSVTELDRVRQSACIIVAGDVKGEGEVGNLVIPGGRYAVGRFELLTDDFERAWNTMCKWFTESGYQQGDGCAYELFHNSHLTHPEKRHIVDICIPVKPL